MIEAGADQVTDKEMFDAIMLAHEECKKLIEFINGIVREVGKPKFDYPSCEVPSDLYESIKEMVIDDVKAALDTDDKNIRDERMQPIYERVYEAYAEDYADNHVLLDEILYKVQKYVVRRWPCTCRNICAHV